MALAQLLGNPIQILSKRTVKPKRPGHHMLQSSRPSSQEPEEHRDKGPAGAAQAAAATSR